MFLYFLLWYLGASLLTIVAFFLYKRFAENRSWRIPEKWLHSLELCGGWSGALVASELFKHKRSKPKYMYVLYAISALHISSWIFWFTRV